MNRIIFILVFVFSHFLVLGQSTFLDRNMDDYSQLERLDILRGRVSQDFYTNSGTATRKDAVTFLLEYLEYLKKEELTEKYEKDIKEIEAILAKNGEWVSEESSESEYNLFDIFYKKRAEFVSAQSDDFFIAANPILNYQQMIEFGNTSQNLFQNRKGIELRGTIKNRIGFYTAFMDNQERGPLYHQAYVKKYEGIPGGATYYKDFKPEKAGRANDFLTATGYVDAELIKNTLNVSFGQNRFHMGDGNRSMFLSDFGSNYLFLRFNTKFWKLNYQNLFMELTPQYDRGSDRLLPKKYAAKHHLNINITNWLNVGVFESVIFSRPNHFEFQYLNPVILYRAVEQGLGSPDNALLGIDFKMNPNIGAVFYGQLLLDEFKFSELTGGNAWWANKFSTQLGVKMADPFGVKNLLVQTEVNIVRPFMYSYYDGINEYSHYNQSLAHPLGSNLAEIVLNVNYKPHQKVLFNLNAFYLKQGRDSSNTISYGSNIFLPSSLRQGNYGNTFLNGFSSEILYANLNASYEFKPNVYLDLGGGIRSEKGSNAFNPNDNSAFLYGGLRWNTSRRRYNY